MTTRADLRPTHGALQHATDWHRQLANRELADSVDETLAVLADPDAMSAIEDDEMERRSTDG